MTGPVYFISILMEKKKLYPNCYEIMGKKKKEEREKSGWDIREGG